MSLGRFSGRGKQVARSLGEGWLLTYPWATSIKCPVTTILVLKTQWSQVQQVDRCLSLLCEEFLLPTWLLHLVFKQTTLQGIFFPLHRCIFLILTWKKKWGVQLPGIIFIGDMFSLNLKSLAYILLSAWTFPSTPILLVKSFSPVKAQFWGHFLWTLRASIITLIILHPHCPLTLLPLG